MRGSITGVGITIGDGQICGAPAKYPGGKCGWHRRRK
jgi:hypothetical protein